MTAAEWKALWEAEARKRMLAEQDLSGKRLQIDGLKRELDAVRDESPGIKDAKAVYAHWVSRIAPKARAFGPKRKKAVLARLSEGHSVDDLKHAIDGAALVPWTRDGVTYDDLATICKNEAAVAHFMQVADRRLRQREHRVCEHPLAEHLVRLGAGPGEFDALFDVWRFSCPCCLRAAAERGLGMLLRRDGAKWVCRTLVMSCSGDLVLCGVCGATAGTLVGGLRWLADVKGRPDAGAVEGPQLELAA